MQLSLRRATQVRTDLEKLCATLPTTPVKISVYEIDVDTAVAAKRQEILDALALHDQLESVLFLLRKAIGRKNVESGISDALANQAHLDVRRRRLEKLIATKPVHLDLIRGKITTARERVAKGEQNSYFRSPQFTDEIEADVLHKADIDRLTAELIDVKRQLREIAGTLIDLNSRATLDLAETDAELLRRHGVL